MNDPTDSNPGADAEAVLPVANDALTRDLLPGPRDPFDEVVRFAYTFDGYAHFGMELLAGIANRAISHFYREKALPSWLEGDLDRLRGCLFFEARRWIVLEREPDAKARIYCQRVIEAIGRGLDPH